MEKDTILRRHLTDLARRSYNKNIYTCTNFLSMADVDVFHSVLAEIGDIPYQLYGGADACERVMLRFGSEETTGYAVPFPIALLIAAPLADKFSDELTHRDMLGALMNLGIERELIGDIRIQPSAQSGILNTAYIFCTTQIADYIVENLTQIKHTQIRCRIASDAALQNLQPTYEELRLITASSRIDAIVSAITKLSRSKSVLLFREKKVYVNSRCCENNSYTLKPEDAIAIRGYGKYIYKGSDGETRKGNSYVTLARLV